MANIEPARDTAGRLFEFMPQAGYTGAATTPIHKYGAGPFCKFRVDTNHGEGVYAFIVAGTVKYVGECEDLGSRMNAGYGNISPRNCFRGGQPTNCRVNALVLAEAARGQRIALWFHPTHDRKAVEAVVIRALQPPWNRAGIQRPLSSSASTRFEPFVMGAAQPQPRPSSPSFEPFVMGAAQRRPAPTAPSVFAGLARAEAVTPRDRSTAERPVRLVWAIADEMLAANPSVSRREVIAECVQRGIALNTAKTQYSLWRTFRGLRRGA